MLALNRILSAELQYFCELAKVISASIDMVVSRKCHLYVLALQAGLDLSDVVAVFALSPLAGEAYAFPRESSTPS